MNYSLGEAAEALRKELRRLVAEHFPPSFLGAFTEDPADLEATQRFCRVLAERGLLAKAWPTEYGGGGGTIWEQTVLREEMWAHHEPRGPQYMGINWVGPAIMAFGTEEQKARHLPPIAEGRVIWCQGCSEPGAGSDLASLSTRALQVGEGWRISGQKIWTSYANVADWCVLAARVGEGAGREGITVFLLPMDRPGITVRPIDSMLGPYHLNELFLDEVEAWPEEVLGGVGQGWAVIRDALDFERVGIARYARCDRLLCELRRSDPPGWLSQPDSLRTDAARAAVKLRIARLLAYRAVAAQDQGRPFRELASMARIAATLCDQEVAELLSEALGPAALEDASSPSAPLHGAVEDHWRYSQAATVASGAIEIQRLLVARSLLADTGTAGSPAPRPALGGGRGGVETELPEAAVELGRVAAEAFRRAGGVDLARRAGRDPGVREAEAAPQVEKLGARDMGDPSDLDSLMAACQLARAAGAVALPYPVVAMMAGAADGAGPVALVDARDPRVDHADLLPALRVATLSARGPRHWALASPQGAPAGAKLGPFVRRVVLQGGCGGPQCGAEVALCLGAWWILGLLESALSLTVAHVRAREQFGRPLAALQSVQFALADAAVCLAGLEELAKFTSWRLCQGAPQRLADALALRLAALDAARSVMRSCHQLHGALGFCEEHDLCVLSRSLRPAVALPLDRSRTEALLLELTDREPLDSLFSH